MNLLDCTLRDGGHSVKFDWPMEMAQEYYALMQDIGISTIELGYWKQTNKYTAPFFNLNMDTAEAVVNGNANKDASIMIEYHYCVKDVREFPKVNEQDIIKMIRMCSRKQDIKEALEFGTRLKDYTGLEMSINIFNISNYTPNELMDVCNAVCRYDLEFTYFADTHGALNLMVDYDQLFKDPINVLKDAGKKVGLHFHNHTGKEYSNYLYIRNKDIDMTDTTVHGIGKGAGNLKLEHVIGGYETKLKLITFIDKWFHILKKDFSTYFYTTGVFGICESYAQQAESMNMPLPDFIEFCTNLDIFYKDVYDKKLLEEN